MSMIEECPASTMFRPTKKPFWDISESSSISSGSRASSINSLSEVQDLNVVNILKSNAKVSREQPSFDLFLGETLEASDDCKNFDDNLFPEEIYERVEDFLDQEGLFIVTPSTSKRFNTGLFNIDATLCNGSFFRSDRSTVIDMSDAPFSDSQISFGCPSFLLRRTTSGGAKPSNFSLQMCQMKSEPLSSYELNSAQAACHINTSKRLVFESQDVFNEEAEVEFLAEKAQI